MLSKEDAEKLRMRYCKKKERKVSPN